MNEARHGMNLRVHETIFFSLPRTTWQTRHSLRLEKGLHWKEYPRQKWRWIFRREDKGRQDKTQTKRWLLSGSKDICFCLCRRHETEERCKRRCGRRKNNKKGKIAKSEAGQEWKRFLKGSWLLSLSWEGRRDNALIESPIDSRGRMRALYPLKV